MPKSEDLRRPYVKKHGGCTYYINPRGATIVIEPNGDAYRFDIIQGKGTISPLEKPFIPNLDFYVDETKVIGDSKCDAGYFHKYFAVFGFE